MLELKLFRKLTKETYSEYISIARLKSSEARTMYSIYKKYYANTVFEIFEKDLYGKTGVFIIREPKKNKIVGFSTIIERDFQVHGKLVHGFFSGDTIIEEAYWGSRALQRAMFRYVISFKIKHFSQPIYWILISKGFKTYLLLANNYLTYYPNVAQDNEHLLEYVEAYCDQFFNEYYNTKTQLIDFGQNYQCLKADVAPITNQMREKNAKIAFFEKINPTWEKGTELPCIGVLTWSDLFKIATQFARKSSKKGQVEPQQISASTEQNLVKTKAQDESKVA